MGGARLAARQQQTDQTSYQPYACNRFPYRHRAPIIRQVEILRSWSRAQVIRTQADRPSVGFARWSLMLAAVALAVAPLSASALNDKGPPAQTAAAAAVAPSQFRPLVPSRLLDTRIPPAMSVAGGSSRQLMVAGQGGVPAAATAVILNVTAVSPTLAGWLSVYPDLTDFNGTSIVNFVAGSIRAALVEVPLGTNGAIRIYNATGTINVVVDVSGYFEADKGDGSGLYRTLTPARLLDTRNGVGGISRIGPGQVANLQVAGRGNVPASGVSAVALNLTGIMPAEQTFVQVFPAGAQPITATSTINLVPGDVVPNKVIVRVGAGGQVSLFNAAGTVDLVADVTGWFSDGSDPTARGGVFNPVIPSRVLDTRSGVGGFAGPVGPRQAISVQISGVGGVPATDVGAVFATATQTNARGSSSFLAAYASGTALPYVSDLNWQPGSTSANAVVSRLGVDGKLNLFVFDGDTALVVDVEGWFSAVANPASPPGAPVITSAAVGSMHPATIRLGWTAPDPAGSQIVSYTIQTATGSPLFAVPGGTMVADVAVSCGVNQSFQVVASNGSGSGAATGSPGVTVPCFRRMGIPWRAMTHPLSCESASLQMMLAYYGNGSTQDDVMAFIGQDLRRPYWDARGLRWGDPYQTFVGSVDGSESNYTGYGMKFPPLQNAAVHFGLPLIRAGEGVSPSDLYDALWQGHPAIVWGSYDYVPHPAVSYTAFDERQVLWGRFFEHVYVVAYVDEGSVGILDPLRSGSMIYLPKSQFESQWGEFYNAGMIFQ